MKKGKEFGGIIPPMVTPFDTEGGIVEDIFRREVRYLIGCGIHGLSLGGSIGEGAALTDEELVRLIGVAKSANKKDLPIIAGVIRTSTQAAIKTALAAKTGGADALLVTPVFYDILIPDENGNELFYRTIAEATGLPIIVYNIVSQNEITPKAFSKLLDIKEVVGIKQVVGGIMAFYDMKLENGGKGMIYSATDEMIYSTFDLGADGAISAILTLFPHLCVKMWNCVKSGHHEEAKAIQDSLYPLWKVVRGPQILSRMKAVLKIMGRDCGIPRRPMSEMNAAQVSKLNTFLAYVKDE